MEFVLMTLSWSRQTMRMNVPPWALGHLIMLGQEREQTRKDEVEGEERRGEGTRGVRQP